MSWFKTKLVISKFYFKDLVVGFDTSEETKSLAKFEAQNQKGLLHSIIE